MFTYSQGFTSIRKMVTVFLEKGIDIDKLEPLDRLIESAKIDQIRVLNSYQPLAVQRILFGALRNIDSVVGAMKGKIKIARETHENPKTLETSLEILEYLSNLAPYIDGFHTKGKTEDTERISELSRILYRKANHLGFYGDIETQLKDAKIADDDVKAFVGKLTENIELEVETLEESSQ